MYDVAKNSTDLLNNLTEYNSKVLTAKKHEQIVLFIILTDKL